MIYPSYKRPIEYINNKPYLIHIIPIERVRDVKGIKEWLGCDTSFKVRGRDYWFCEEIKRESIGNMFRQKIILTKEECNELIELCNNFNPSRLYNKDSGVYVKMIEETQNNLSLQT